MAKRGRRAARASKRQLFAAEVAAADALARMVDDARAAVLALLAIKAAPPEPGLAELLAGSALGAAGASSSGPAKRKRGEDENVLPLAKPAGKRPRACRQAQHEQEAAEVAGVLEVQTRSGRTAKRFKIVGG